MRKIIFSKKGQVQNIAPAIIALVIAAVFLILGLVMLQEVRDTDLIARSQSTSITNESSTIVAAGDSLAGAGSPGSRSFTITQVRNITGVVIAAPNYTINANTGVISNATDRTFPSVFVDYSYVHGDEAYKGANTTLVGLGTMSSFWEIIVLAVVITIVIGLLLVVFGGRRER